jgi:hypothetical protein
MRSLTDLLTGRAMQDKRSGFIGANGGEVNYLSPLYGTCLGWGDGCRSNSGDGEGDSTGRGYGIRCRHGREETAFLPELGRYA